MYRLYEFSCVNKHTTEELINPDVKEISCSICGESGKRLISPKQHEKAAKV